MGWVADLECPFKMLGLVVKSILSDTLQLEVLVNQLRREYAIVGFSNLVLGVTVRQMVQYRPN